MTAQTSKKWVITGGAGFIGSAIVRLLLRRGADITVVDDFSADGAYLPPEIKNKIRLLRGSILDEKLLLRAFKGAHTVLHLAAVASVEESFLHPDKVFQTNVLGTARVLQAAQVCGVQRILFASSSAVYGAGATRPHRETNLPAPCSPYGTSKLIGEQLCALYSQAYGLNCVITRCFNIYGQGQRAQSAYAAVLAKWISLAAEGKPLTLHADGKQTRDFLHVTDAAQALLCVAQKGRPGQIYNVGSGHSITLLQAAQTLRRISGKKLPFTLLSARTGDIRRSAANTTALQKLGFSPKISLLQGLQELYHETQIKKMRK